MYKIRAFWRCFMINHPACVSLWIVACYVTVGGCVIHRLCWALLSFIIHCDWTGVICNIVVCVLFMCICLLMKRWKTCNSVCMNLYEGMQMVGVYNVLFIYILCTEYELVAVTSSRLTWLINRLQLNMKWMWRYFVFLAEESVFDMMVYKMFSFFKL